MGVAMLASNSDKGIADEAEAKVYGTDINYPLNKSVPSNWYT